MATVAINLYINKFIADTEHFGLELLAIDTADGNGNDQLAVVYESRDSLSSLEDAVVDALILSDSMIDEGRCPDIYILDWFT